MLLRHKADLMGMARNLCSLQQQLFAPIISSEAMVACLYDIPFEARYSGRCMPFVYVRKKSTLRYTVFLVVRFNLLEH
jgi:hypothetical protein